jgi:ATP-dependent Lon protease
LDVPQSDDLFLLNINKEQPVGTANGLAFVNDGYGSILKIQFVKKDYGISSKKKEDSEKDDESSLGTFTHTGRLGETMSESVEIVKIVVFNFLK